MKAQPRATVRVADIVVVREDGPPNRVSASEVLIAVEIISPGSRGIDMRRKLVEYAEAGIPRYWLVDLDPPAPTITVFGPGAPGDGYAESQTAASELVVVDPFPLRVDVEALVAPRR